jgi:uncharacterized protein
MPVKRFRFLLWLSMIVSACSPSPAQRTRAMQFTGANATLELAIEADDPAAVDRSILQGANADARGTNGVTPLSYAVGTKKKAAVAALIRHRADPNLRDDQGYSAMSLAAELYAGDRWYLSALLDAGGDPNIRRPDGDPLITRFINDRNLEAISWLHAKGARIDGEIGGDPMLLDAAFAVDWDVVLRLLELGAKLDAPQIREGMKLAFNSPAVTLTDSPLYPAKVQVWRRLRAAGIDATPPEGINPEGTASTR